MNLYNLLPEQDKKIMYNYITIYGVVPEHYIGNEVFFQPWAESKSKLYHLLGNKFIHKIPYSVEIPKSDIYHAMRDIVHQNVENSLENEVNRLTVKWATEEGRISSKTRTDILNIFSTDYFLDNKIGIDITLTSMGKKLFIQKGTKPIKAIIKILQYFNEYTDERKKLVEDFRIKVSQVLNTKTLYGNLVMSIHPMDYMTMSDNAYNWSSCMSWEEHGCYFVGSEEMMNSNNVICCYLESNNNPLFCFKDKKNKKNPEEYPEYSWTNKKFRQLFYVNKDIICSGKSYPYKDNKITETILTELRKLAKENMHWNYAFGPQDYYDMTRYDSDDYFYLDDVLYEPGKKILFDTKAMYHDMMNDGQYGYRCVRNPVKKNKLISISGKVKCLCCGEDPRQERDRWDRESYNDKIQNTGQLVCEGCFEDFFKCVCCQNAYDDEKYLSNKKLIEVSGYGTVCKTCYSDYLRICPCCGKYFYDSTYNGDRPVAMIAGHEHTYENLYAVLQWYSKCYTSVELIEKYGFVPLHCCEECSETIKNNDCVHWKSLKDTIILKEDCFGNYDKEHVGRWVLPMKYDANDEEISKYFRENLRKLSSLEE